MFELNQGLEMKVLLYRHLTAFCLLLLPTPLNPALVLLGIAVVGDAHKQ